MITHNRCRNCGTFIDPETDMDDGYCGACVESFVAANAEVEPKAFHPKPTAQIDAECGFTHRRRPTSSLPRPAEIAFAPRLLTREECEALLPEAV